MLSIEVISLPLRKVITDIAHKLQVPYSENCSIYRLEIPQHIGHGTITGIDFDQGLGLIRYDVMFDQDIQFEFTANDTHPLKFLFCEEGEIGHRFSNEDHWHNITEYKNAIVASSLTNGHIVKFKRNERTIWNSLEIDRSMFQSRLQCGTEDLAAEVKEVLNDVGAVATFYHEGYYSLEMSRAFDSLGLGETNSFLKKISLEGLANQILYLQILQFQDDLRIDGNRTVLRKYELVQLKVAVNFIKDNIGDLPVINEIAVDVGLNVKKLQQGFQEIMGCTVNTYIRMLRLEKAKTLLIETDQSLATISSIIGYNSNSYFSKIFKDEFHISPIDFRKNASYSKVSRTDIS